jgi:hypothetical protein
MATCSDKATSSKSELEIRPIDYGSCIEIQVATNDNVYERDQPITVTAKLVVLNDVRVSIARNRRSSLNFELDIVDGRGKAIQRTEEGMAMLNIKPALVDTVVSLDQPFQESFRIDKWFDLSQPDTYTLTVKQVVRFWEPAEVIEAVGNPVIFTRLP